MAPPLFDGEHEGPPLWRMFGVLLPPWGGMGSVRCSLSASAIVEKAPDTGVAFVVAHVFVAALFGLGSFVGVRRRVCAVDFGPVVSVDHRALAAVGQLGQDVGDGRVGAGLNVVAVPRVHISLEDLLADVAEVLGVSDVGVGLLLRAGLQHEGAGLLARHDPLGGVSGYFGSVLFVGVGVQGVLVAVAASGCFLLFCRRGCCLYCWVLSVLFALCWLFMLGTLIAEEASGEQRSQPVGRGGG